ncbi:uncharacterized protein LOC122135941 isoform X1 [Cyprinus carpio]|uniref:Uncharacterized protein LOC122135941 isoform X1 n=1 Tax=Cyprinus carpio TaxID=7962 RepID=A0A9Q9VXP0_CYPCA|nr:uncharacterized protein LOC122135941 isoform X1 [Cyprinus carpio]XP_042573105.1 uncharacterized protein LOC122135941 isoform X1 [Cyprinus carpio]
MLEKQALRHLRKKLFPQQYPDLLPASLQIQRLQNQLQLPNDLHLASKHLNPNQMTKKVYQHVRCLLVHETTPHCQHQAKTFQHLPVTNNQVAWSVRSFSQLNHHSLSMESQHEKEPATKPDDKEPTTKPDVKEPAAEPVQLLAAAVATVAVATAAAIAREESVSGPEATPTVESSLDVPASSLDVQEMVDVQVTNVSSQCVLDISNMEPESQKALIEAGSVEVACPTSSVADQESEELVSGKVDEKLIVAEAPAAQEATEQESLTASQFDNSAATIVSSGVEVAEKAERINSDCYEDVEEEEREGSQQVFSVRNEWHPAYGRVSTWVSWACRLHLAGRGLAF